MGQALYRLYRPKSLADVSGQEHITATLQKAIDSKQISHAYLLTGPRGVGKTTVARILAHAVNGLDYNDDTAHLDIIEIDAASNRRIDEIRELRERVYVTPTELKYKVYIIDEVHMLTREAFNALLKTLEEPPEHVIFILATTDTHKLPETIISRTQHYSFRPISQDAAIKRLEIIAAEENIKISSSALKLLAEHGDGSLRDSIGLLDQIKSHSNSVDENNVRDLLGLPKDSAIDELINLIFNSGSAGDILTGVNDLYTSCYQASVIAHLMSKRIREHIINNDGSLDADNGLNLLANLIDVPSSPDPEQLLEIILLKNRSSLGSEPIKEVPHTPEPKVVEKVVPKKASSNDPPGKNQAKPKKSNSIDERLWQDVLTEVKAKYNTLYGILRMADANLTKDSLLLTFAFPFHEKRIKEASNKKIIEEIASKLSGRTLTLDCRVDKSLGNKPQETHKEIEVNDSLSTISSIFNGAELLES